MNPAVLTMALAFAHAESPVIHASPAPALLPATMEQSDAWRSARAHELQGCGRRDAQRTSVRVLCNDDWLFVGFSCADASVVSPGARDGIDHFRLGDTAEVFLARRGAKEYVEVHATPAGRKTVYFCRDYRKAAEPPAGAARISICSAPEKGGWRAFVAIPRDLLDGGGDDDYDIFFARYDYASEGGEPVLSSFPAQRGDKPDFHRRGDYAILRIAP